MLTPETINIHARSEFIPKKSLLKIVHRN